MIIVPEISIFEAVLIFGSFGGLVGLIGGGVLGFMGGFMLIFKAFLAGLIGGSVLGFMVRFCEFYQNKFKLIEKINDQLDEIQESVNELNENKYSKSTFE